MKPRTALSGSADNSNLGGSTRRLRRWGKQRENAGWTQKHADLSPKVGLNSEKSWGLSRKLGTWQRKMLVLLGKVIDLTNKTGGVACKTWWLNQQKLWPYQQHRQMTWHYMTLHGNTLQHMTWHCISLGFSPWHYTTWHYLTSHPYLWQLRAWEGEGDIGGKKKAELCTFMLPEVTNTYSSPFSPICMF